MEATSTWEIRPYQSGDEQQLVTLFQRVFKHSITEAHWRWKLCGQPTPINNVWLAVSGERVVGQYACIPTRFWLDGQVRWVMVGVDAMVDPAFRRRGMWTALVTHAHQVWASAGVVFALGLPNERWGSRRDALGWRSLFGLKWQIRPLQPITLLAHRLHLTCAPPFPLLSAVWNRYWNGQLARDPAIEWVQVTRAGDDIDQLWLAARAHLHISVVRDHSWVQWRYLDTPDKKYYVFLAVQRGQPVGYVAYTWRDTQNGKLALLADLFSLPTHQQIGETLLRLAVAHLAAEGAHAVAALAIPRSPLAHLLQRAGFRFSWGTFDVRAVPLDTQWPSVYLCQHDKWLLTGGEFDAV